MMKSARWMLGLLMVQSLACSSEPEAPQTGGGGAGGAASGGSAAGGSAGTGIQKNYGTFGTGSVVCPLVAAGECAAGSGCCMRRPFQDDLCVSSRAECICQPGDPCSVTGCDQPADCPGQVCCGTFGGVLGEFAGSSCKASCDAVLDAVVCSQDSDCQPGQHCMRSSSGYDRCF